MIVFVDHFSKYIWIYLSANKEAVTVLKCIKDVFNSLDASLPEYFHTDNGPEFIAKIVGDYLVSLGI